MKDKKALMVSQLQEDTLTKSEAQKAVQEIRALQNLADADEHNNSVLKNQLQRCAEPQGLRRCSTHQSHNLMSSVREKNKFLESFRDNANCKKQTPR